MYYSKLTLKDLFADSSLAHILPQVDKNKQNTKSEYSHAEVLEQVSNYLKNTFGGSLLADGTIVVKGNYKAILRQIRGLQSTLEQLFNSMPNIAKNINNNEKLYLSATNKNEIISKVKTPDQKKNLIQEILDNLNYNHRFNSLNTVASDEAMPFIQRMDKWTMGTSIKY